MTTINHDILEVEEPGYGIDRVNMQAVATSIGKRLVVSMVIGNGEGIQVFALTADQTRKLTDILTGGN